MIIHFLVVRQTAKGSIFMAVPHDYTENQLRKVRVNVVRAAPLLVLRCDECGATWQVKQKGLRMPKGYWKCPNGCNREPSGH